MLPAVTTLADAVADAKERYTQLVLLVGPKGSGKTALLKAYAHATGRPYSPVGAAVAERLLAVPPRFWDTEADKSLRALCQGSGPFLLDNLELLFAPELQLDPYRLLAGLARTRTIVASWAGSLENGTLTYAVPGRKEYRSFNPSDAICIQI